MDTFRRQHPGVVGYTYWGYRHNGRKTNRGVIVFLMLKMEYDHLITLLLPYTFFFFLKFWKNRVAA